VRDKEGHTLRSCGLRDRWIKRKGYMFTSNHQGYSEGKSERMLANAITKKYLQSTAAYMGDAGAMQGVPRYTVNCGRGRKEGCRIRKRATADTGIPSPGAGRS